jgi:hypothetical protein
MLPLSAPAIERSMNQMRPETTVLKTLYYKGHTEGQLYPFAPAIFKDKHQLLRMKLSTAISCIEYQGTITLPSKCIQNIDRE